MSASQRDALHDLCRAILACDCATPDVRFRARNLQACVALDAMWARILG